MSPAARLRRTHLADLRAGARRGLRDGQLRSSELGPAGRWRSPRPPTSPPRSASRLVPRQLRSQVGCRPSRGSSAASGAPPAPRQLDAGRRLAAAPLRGRGLADPAHPTGPPGRASGAGESARSPTSRPSSTASRPCHRRGCGRRRRRARARRAPHAPVAHQRRDSSARRRVDRHRQAEPDAGHAVLIRAAAPRPSTSAPPCRVARGLDRSVGPASRALLACVQATVATPQQLADALVRLTGHINRTASPDMFRVLGEVGLSFTQMKALFVLSERDEMTVKRPRRPPRDVAPRDVALGRRPRPARLRRARGVPSDRRSKRLALLPPGREVLDRVTAAREAAIVAFAAELSDAERTALHAALLPIAERITSP